jgi:anti-sigma regulatory factor (Ser/Thr protein kinase)
VTLWAARALPRADAPSALTWRWQPRTPADLTAIRRELAAAVATAPVPHASDAEAVERLLLAFEELASNGIRHGRAPIGVRVVATPAGWLVDVTDGATEQPPSPAVDRDPSAGGLGLYLIARLSAAHGWTVALGRKHVWACVPCPTAA